MTNTSVLVVGGGPAGLTMSLLLSQFGVSHMLVDRRPDTSNHPRGRLYDICTLELFRQFGVQAEVEATGAGPRCTLAATRIEQSLKISRLTAPLLSAHFGERDTTEQKSALKLWGNYDGLILGFEHRSPLCLAEHAPAPHEGDPIRDFVPAVRSGRRAPHLWLDSAHERSSLDWFNTDYVVIPGGGVDEAPWTGAASKLAGSGFPIRTERLPGDDVAPWSQDEIVLVRPDGIVAAHWVPDAGAPLRLLNGILPLRAPLE